MGPTTSRAPFGVRVDSDDGFKRLAAVGELDMGSAPVLAQALDDITDGDSSTVVILSLKGLEFLDSSGLRCLVEAHGRCRLVLGPGPDHVSRIFRQAGVDRALNFLP